MSGGRPRGTKAVTPARRAWARRMVESKAMTIGEVAAVLGVSRRTVYRYLREGSGE